uniref:Isochorismatase domain-containing protein n=1 Tax=Ascaris lumbricoides TaxID=6252 RepID=A0A0M3IKR5_ASCLU
MISGSMVMVDTTCVSRTARELISRKAKYFPIFLNVFDMYM